MPTHTSNLTVSVIVPLHRLTPQSQECLDALLNLEDPRAEIIVVCDHRPFGLPDQVRVIETGAPVDTSPAEKRDAALPQIEAPICAFIDDDAYPAPDWIARALDRLESDPSIDALGGPGVTPPGSCLRRRLSGAFYESRLGSGGLRNRFIPLSRRNDVDDWPAYNFFVRTDPLRSVGGWGSRYYGGEDTKLCLALREAGYRIAYEPDVIVYHHRRPVFAALMRQTANVGRRRGSFVRRYPATSRRLIYFMPALAVLTAPFLLIAATRSRVRRRAGIGTAGAWCAVATLSLSDGASLAEALALPTVLAAGHGAYGWGFLRGLLSRREDEMP